MSKPVGQTLILGSVIAVSCAVVAYLVLFWNQNGNTAELPISKFTLKDIPFDGAKAFENLKKICQIGPRISGTPGMDKQQELVADHFKQLGAKVERQEFEIRNPENGKPLTMTNLIITWHPERMDRILLCTHYDTRPYPDRDLRNKRGKFIGANDGASGTALLMELGKEMPKLTGKVGVDFVLFDGEEFIFDDKRDTYFLGSEYFAKKYIDSPPAHKYRSAVLLDMVGDMDLQLFQEHNSVTWSDSKPLVDAIWNTAQQLGVREFIPKERHDLRDDHLALHNIGKIPACDIIDFDYGPNHSYWHTMADTPEHCSPLSLAKVGWVLSEWLKKQE